ncbi:MAG TPA: hypothetical protein VII56_13165 [Rhizomicrobium sp.]
MKWISNLSGFYVKCVTSFDRLGVLSTRVEDLGGDLNDVSVRIGRVEGAVINSSNPELLRQMLDIQRRLTLIEAHLLNSFNGDSTPNSRAINSDETNGAKKKLKRLGRG